MDEFDREKQMFECFKRRKIWLSRVCIPRIPASRPDNLLY